MRIALVHSFYSKQFSSGVGTYINTLESAFSRRATLTTCLGSEGKYFRSFGLSRLRLFFIFTTIGRLKRLIDDFKPDIIHTQGVQYPASRDLLFLRTNAKLIVTQQGIALGGNFIISFFVQLYLQTIGRLIFARASAVIVTSHFTESMIAPFVARKSKIHCIYTGVDEHTFYPTAPAERTALRLHWRFPDEDTLIFSGRLVPVKNVSTIIRSLQYCRAQLCIVGNGWEEQNLKRLVLRLGLSQRVRFLGYRSEHELRELYALSDLLVLASHYEGIPFAILEAMACGTPALASHVGGVGEAIEHGTNGFLINRGMTPEALGRGITSALKTIRQTPDIRDSARQTILKRFTLQTMIEQTEAVYREVLAS